MTGLTAFVVVVALVGLERLAELVVSRRNAAWSFARGAIETGRGHYRVMVVLHTGFLVAMLVEAVVRRPEVPPALAWSMLLWMASKTAWTELKPCTATCSSPRIVLICNSAPERQTANTTSQAVSAEEMTRVRCPS